MVIKTEAEVEQQALEFRNLPGPFKFYLPMPPEKQQGQGSGFIINEYGHVITNHHVIEGAQKIIVTVGLEAREYKAKIIGFDEPLDIALLQLENTDKEKIKWPYLPLGDSNIAELGDPVLGLGSPLGLIQSVNEGIISGKFRGGIRPSGRDLFAEVIQLQMPINPGNSGGPIIDRFGRVVAVAESIMSPVHGQAIAFGLPINTIKEILPQLLAHGQVERAFLGVADPADLTPDLAKQLGLSPNEKGAVITQIIPNTPAEHAGLKAGDVILEIDGQKVVDAFNLRKQTAYKGVGKVVNIKVFREGEGYKTIKAKLEKRPGDSAQMLRLEKDSSVVNIDSIGLMVKDTLEQTRLRRGLPSSNPGAEVVNFQPKNKKNLLSQLTPGDIITSVGNIKITSAKQLKEIIDNIKKDELFTIRAYPANEGNQRFIQLRK